MFKKVLVPVDFSPKSHHSLAMAKRIVRHSGGEIDLFHVVQAALTAKKNDVGEYESLAKGGQALLEEIVSKNEKRLKKLAEEYESDDTPINLRLKVDEIPDQVAEHIHEEKYDLLIIGSHTQHGLGEVFGEQHTDKIVKLARKPVLVMNEPATTEPIKQIMVPTNLTDPYGHQADVLKNVQDFFGAHLTFLYINTPGSFKTTYEIDLLIEAFKEQYKFENCSFKVIADKDRKKGIIQAAEYLEAHMVCLLSFQSNRLWKFFRGDLTEYLVDHCPPPVMILNVER